MLAPAVVKRRFQLVLIKPSHYDDDGYVIQWWRSSIPANSLACVYTIAADAAARAVLGTDVEIDITPMDESNTRVRIKKIIDLIRRHDGFGLVGLVGVQSNQFPRSLDIARPLRAAGIPVAIGGFHVSGCLAMLPEMPAELQGALDMGCSLFAGEAEEGRLALILRDAAVGAMKPIYDFMKELPALDSAPTPYLPARILGRTIKHHASFDAGRGCPFQCSFCTIINVQGRKSRRRTPDDIERLVRQHAAEGVHRFFITDDNFARNKDWEIIFDRLIELRERDRLPIILSIQVDTLCHEIPNFVEKAKLAGVRRVFIGMESINPANLMAAKKRQNKITEYRKLLLAWKNAGVITYAGYIIGFPEDTPETLREDIEIIKRELPVDILQFYFLTPLPGSEDHKVLWQKGAWMDPDLNKYDLEHAVAHHPKMSREQFEAAYRSAWDTFYTREHMTTIMKRGAASGIGLARLVTILGLFSYFMQVEKIHPLQGGLIRLKFRRDRRPGFPIEPAWSFYPTFVAETFSKQFKLWGNFLRLARVRFAIRRDPQHRLYTDCALTPVADDDTETLEMFTHNVGARNAVAHVRKIDALTHAAHTPATAAVAK